MILLLAPGFKQTETPIPVPSIQKLQGALSFLEVGHVQALQAQYLQFSDLHCLANGFKSLLLPRPSAAEPLTLHLRSAPGQAEPLRRPRWPPLPRPHTLATSTSTSRQGQPEEQRQMEAAERHPDCPILKIKKSGACLVELTVTVCATNVVWKGQREAEASAVCKAGSAGWDTGFHCDTYRKCKSVSICVHIYFYIERESYVSICM